MRPPWTLRPKKGVLYGAKSSINSLLEHHPKFGITAQDIIASLYELHGAVARDASTPEMFEWRTFTMNLLEDRIGEIVQTGLVKNLFTEYVPAQEDDHKLTIPERHVFENLDEFHAIPYLARFRDKVGFIGFIRDQRTILGLYQGGETVPAGVVMRVDEVIKRLPTAFEIKRDVSRDPKPPQDSL